MVNKNLSLGIIGGGQLGSLLAEAAKKLKIKTIILTDDPKAPARNFCDEIIISKYSDEEKIKKFIEKTNIVTFEFENIPFEILDLIEKKRKVLPSPKINRIVQNRKIEKTFINKLGIQTTAWAFIKSKKDIERNSELLPGILKTCSFGYDGKGQYVINNILDIKNEWCFTDEYILEKFVKLKQEISVIITRFENGKCTTYEPVENIHENQILKNSKIPANISQKNFKESQEKAKIIAEKLNYIGTMCVEYFIDQKDNLLVNEIAPRVHNSGHLTINAFNVSQFENHIRAICDLEILELNKINNAEMTNIIGNEINTYRKRKYLENEFFFDYLKEEVRDKRKMGHLTTTKF